VDSPRTDGQDARMPADQVQGEKHGADQACTEDARTDGQPGTSAETEGRQREPAQGHAPEGRGRGADLGQLDPDRVQADDDRAEQHDRQVGNGQVPGTGL